MATPVGHTLVGLAIARRLGVRTPGGLLKAALAANLPDSDLLASYALHGDFWKLHRKGTHTLSFALSTGMAAGFSGVLSAGSAEGERDLIADAMTGAAVVGSHVLVDNLPWRYRATRDGEPFSARVKNETVNMIFDAVVYGAFAWLLWPKNARR